LLQCVVKACGALLVSSTCKTLPCVIMHCMLGGGFRPKTRYIQKWPLLPKY
jgi:hypothetical protein